MQNTEVLIGSSKKQIFYISFVCKNDEIVFFRVPSLADLPFTITFTKVAGVDPSIEWDGSTGTIMFKAINWENVLGQMTLEAQEIALVDNKRILFHLVQQHQAPNNVVTFYLYEAV